MLGNPGTYANKKRKKPVLKQKRASDGNEVVKSNPSKRHRDRLNGELDRLTELLPFTDDIRTRLDKLSVLRLSVGYLRVKSYFKAGIKNGNSSLMGPGLNGQNSNCIDITGVSEGDLLLQALNGFVMVVTTEGLVFYASPTIKDYLGFHQSDVVHQSVFELIHTDDRAMFRQQLHFALNPPAVADEDGLQGCIDSGTYRPDQLPPENSSFLERSFVCRFRCLLDNSSGFLALKFQGRLKYLHGQSLMRDNGTCGQPQLGLFTIAVPAQPSTIVEIRAKMLLFQTKHQLDFTPLGMDGRAKIILGYSEVELCMKGSGYQFIHAADMMYCADNHIRMIKTGESGLTVFRLLSKTGGWVWVKANAKLIFKGGRPEFIIAYQKALVNAEGEEYLRQRRLQLPFTFTTGEAVLYNNNPTVDPTQFQFNNIFNNSNTEKDGLPSSLVDCFMKQDQSVYSETIEAPLPIDQVFMDSRALVTVPSDAWQENGVSPTAGEPVVVKEEAKQSVMAMIDGLETLSQNGDFTAALQSLDVGDAELTEWENALNRLHEEDDPHGNVRSELDGILTNEIFDYIDSVLFKEKGETGLNNSPPSCLAGVSNLQDTFTEAGQLSSSAPQLFQTPSPVCAYSPVNGLYGHQQEAVSPPEPSQIFNSTQKLSHPCPLPHTNLPPLQQLQLQDIFSPSIELPELTVPDASASDASLKYASRQTSNSIMGCPPGISGQPQPAQSLLSPQNILQDPTVVASRQLLRSSVQQHNGVPSHVMKNLPPLVPCNDLTSTTPPNITVPFSKNLPVGTPFEPHNHQFQQWPQNQQQRPAHCSIVQNGHDPIPACHSLSSESQTFPHAGHLPRSGNGLNHIQQGGLASGQVATHSSCMFGQPFSSRPAGEFTFSGSLSLSGTDTSLSPGPPQGSRYLQWSHSEPVVGTLAINQDNVNVNPLTTFSPNMSTSEHALNIQPYLECQRQTQQDTNVSGEHNRSFFCS